MSFRPHPSCCLWERAGICVAPWAHAGQSAVYFYEQKDFVCVCACVCVWHPWWQQKLCPKARFSRIFKHWTRNRALKYTRGGPAAAWRFEGQGEGSRSALQPGVGKGLDVSCVHLQISEPRCLMRMTQSVISIRSAKPENLGLSIFFAFIVDIMFHWQLMILLFIQSSTQ